MSSDNEARKRELCRQRVARHRARRKAGLYRFAGDLEGAETEDALIELGYLKPDQADDAAAIHAALMEFIASGLRAAFRGL